MKPRPVRRPWWPRGVYRVKEGYNPNSSSIGTVLYSFPLAFVALSSILGVIAALVRRKEPPRR